MALVGALVLSACADETTSGAPTTVPAPWAEPAPWGEAADGAGTVHQVGNITALSAGDFAGRTPVSELHGRGDLGLGTYDGLDGEMVVLDGEVWRVGVDGQPHPASDDVTTPFAQVVAFEPEASFAVTGPTTCAALGEAIDEQAPADAELVALRVDGELSALTLRSVPGQSPPYPTLAEVVADQQVTFELGPITGTLVGFRTGASLASVSPEGFHFHFLSEDEAHGGHVLSCTLDRATVELDPASGLDLALR